MMRNGRHLGTALLFIAPNLAGFLVFTIGPVLFSFAGSFTTWSLRPSVPLRFIGLANYVDLLSDAQFYFYLFNTVYLMLGLPVSIGGSLLLAVLLSQTFTSKGTFTRTRLMTAWIATSSCTAGVFAWAGMEDVAVIFGALGIVGALGLVFGSTAYRTVFYLPHFTAGAATIILWTQLYNPNFGLINHVIESAGQAFGWRVEGPGWLTSTRCLLGFLPLPEAFNNGGFGLGAREAIIIMGIWAAIGGNNMVLYLAGISNIPTELYEAAEIDGANGWGRFRHITWPLLAPTTFFIVVMSVIGGLQGGFEQARLMTEGGPAGITTTLSYYIYIQGFGRLDLGYGSAVAWVLFALIFALTLLNWRFGRGEANE